MVELNLHERREEERRAAEAEHSRWRVNWAAVAVVVSVVSFLLMAASGAFGDYRKLGERVTTLEAQRDGYQRQRAEDINRMEHIEDKIDRLLERRQ